MTSQTRLIVLSLILLVLVVAAGFIGYSIYLDSQAPDDAKAGGGGGACIANETTTLGGANSTVCCENAGWFPENGTYQNSTKCKQNPNGQICGRPVSTYINAWNASSESCNGSGSSCTNNPANTVGICYYGDAGTGKCIYLPSDQCLWFDGGTLKCDCACPTKETICAGGKTGIQSGTCTNCGNKITVDCGGGTTPPPPGGPVCGNGTKETGEMCDDGNTTNGDGCDSSCDTETTRQTAICGQRCDSTIDCLDGTTGVDVTCRNNRCQATNCSEGNTVYGTRCDCNDNNQTCGQACGANTGLGLCNSNDAIPTSCAYVDGPSCRKAAGGATATYCAPIALGPNQVGATPNPNVSRQKCVSRDTSNSYVILADGTTDLRSLSATARYDQLCRWCGNGIIDPGEECDYGQDNGTGIGCSSTCENDETVDLELNIIKNSTERCGPSSSHIVAYDIQLTNLSDKAIDYDDIIDELPGNISEDQVSGITPSTGTQSGNIITWPGGTIAAGDTLEFSYTITLTQAEGNDSGDVLQNIATVTYTDGEGNAAERSYTNIQPLACAPGVDLPNTDLEDNLMYLVAGLLIVSAAVAYKRGFGNELMETLLVKAHGNVRKVVNPKGSFEDKVLNRPEKN